MGVNTIWHKGAAARLAALQVPGWAGAATNDGFQPWHDQAFVDAAHGGIDLVHTEDDIEVVPGKCPDPFVQLTDNFYLLSTATVLRTTHGTNLMVVPHYRFYTDLEWLTPLPVAASWRCDWLPYELHVLFRFGPKGMAKFVRGEPYASVVPVRRGECQLVGMTKEEQKQLAASQKFLARNVDKYETRRWVTSAGIIQSNLYNVLVHLEDRGQLPHELMPVKSKVIGRS